jgi:integrase
MIRLTALGVKNAKPKRNSYGAPDRAEYSDGGGLSLVVQPSGAKSYHFRDRFNGAPINLKLGDAALSEAEAEAGALTLAAARVRAAEARLQIERGVDPRANKPAQTGPDRVETLIAQFLDLHVRRKTRRNSAAATERIFRNVVLPAWRGRSIRDVRRRDVIDLIEHVAVERPYTANRTLAALSKFAGWLVTRDAIAASFTTGVPRPHREVARSRTLDGAELRALWLASAGNDPAARAVRLMILTGCRRNEVGRMRWSEIDAERRLWTIPAERSKNGRAHAVPLSAQAWRVLSGVPRFADCDFVFTLDRSSPDQSLGRRQGAAERQGRDRSGELALARPPPHLCRGDAVARRLGRGHREGVEPRRRRVSRHRRHLSDPRLSRRDSSRIAAMERPSRTDRRRSIR